MSSQNPQVPGGRLIRSAIPATAGNVAYDLSPGNEYRYMLLNIRITLVCDASVANRSIKFAILDSAGTTQYGMGVSSAAITANQTKTLVADQLSGFSTGVVIDGDWYFSIPADRVLIEGSEKIRISITNGVAGDSYSGTISGVFFKT